jgi:alanine-synthesizing transaminase
VNTPAQIALPRLLRSSSDIGGQICGRVQANYRLLQKICTDSKISVFRVEGGWYAILQLPQTHTDDDWAYMFLHRENILVYPGYFFDVEQPSCIVMSLLPDLDIFEDAVFRLRNLIEE